MNSESEFLLYKNGENEELKFDSINLSLYGSEKQDKIENINWAIDEIYQTEKNINLTRENNPFSDRNIYGKLFFVFHKTMNHNSNVHLKEKDFLYTIYLNLNQHNEIVNETDFHSFLERNNINSLYLYYYYYRYHNHVKNDLQYKKEDLSTMEEIMRLCENLFLFFERCNTRPLQAKEPTINHLNSNNVLGILKIKELINKHIGRFFNTNELNFLCRINAKQIQMLKENMNLLTPSQNIKQISIVKDIWTKFVDKFKLEEAILSSQYSKSEQIFTQHNTSLLLELEEILIKEIEDSKVNAFPEGTPSVYFVATVQQYQMIPRESQIIYYFFVILHLSFQILFRSYIETMNYSKNLYPLIYTSFKLSAASKVKSEIIKINNEIWMILLQKYNEYCALFNEFLNPEFTYN